MPAQPLPAAAPFENGPEPVPAPAAAAPEEHVAEEVALLHAPDALGIIGSRTVWTVVFQVKVK